MAWKNVQYENGKMRTSEGGGGSSTFAGLDDVSFSNLQDGQVPKYNSTTEKWENGDESGGGGNVDDVEVNGVSVVDAQKIAKIKSYKEVTQSEYNALPDSKLNDGILYAIKDVGGSDGFPPLIYSDEEREVGVWRDGKPLYQKTYIGTTPNSNAVGISDINSTKNVVNAFGRLYFQGSSIELGAYLNGSYYAGWYQDYTQNGILDLFYSNDYKNAQYEVTVQYTKTTDTAGSGTWTTQGTLAHHYSTDEYIIGTWIDGKPIYEKTVNVGHNYGSPSGEIRPLYYTLPELNIDNIISFSGFDLNGQALPYENQTNQYSIYLYVQNSGQNIQIRKGTQMPYDKDIIVTLQYTKTTD